MYLLKHKMYWFFPHLAIIIKIFEILSGVEFYFDCNPQPLAQNWSGVAILESPPKYQVTKHNFERKKTKCFKTKSDLIRIKPNLGSVPIFLADTVHAASRLNSCTVNFQQKYVAPVKQKKTEFQLVLLLLLNQAGYCSCFILSTYCVFNLCYVCF